MVVKKKRVLTVSFVLMVFLSAAIGTQIPLTKANLYLDYKFGAPPPTDLQPQTIKMSSPENNTIYASSNLTLNFNINLISKLSRNDFHLTTIYYKASWQENDTTVYRWSYHDMDNPYDDDPYLSEYSNELNLTGIPDGEQNITINARIAGVYVKNLIVYSFSLDLSSSVNFIVDTTSPMISVFPIENKTYDTVDVPLILTLNESTSQITYSLDSQESIPIAGNTTLTKLSYGDHNVTVYVVDEAGNTASQTIYFTIAEPFPTVAVAVVAIAVVVGAGLLVYIKKRQRHRNL